ncbi:hypothetical protein PLESTB_001405900 [Pleodorina starrii]|uniref:PCI domain-containing protein n=1 Tax=Pleodorina starrii TaxID=330485 RepID=A0A9W6BV88_9CHLO|nr:hypothetical protein PLESTB_001405900 [Pleodorina starrii]GLC68015.1 hypothetical protein PLESTF_000635800 [Pleodorina starrii]
MPLQLVETSDEDSFVSVAQHVAELLNEGQTRTALADTPATLFLNDCVNLIQEERYAEYIARVSTQVNLIYAKMPEKEAECCISIVVHAVGRVQEDRQQAAATTLATALCQSDERAEERLTALLSLYGIISSQPSAQLAVLLAAAAFAARNSAKCRATFSAAVRGKAQRWVTQWKLGPAESRQLFLALAAAMRGATDRPTTREHLALVGQALSLPGTPDKAPEVVEAAAGALADYLRSAAVYTLDLLPLPAVAGLKDHPKYGALHKLVAAVLAGDVAGARDASTPAALEVAGGVSPEAVLSKARMTALLAACARAGHGEVQLAELRTALDVPEDQVQPWIVRAIGAKLLEGRVDSVRGTLSVARSTHPCFGQQQWTKLASQLAALKETVAAAAAAMSQIRPPPHVVAKGLAAAAAAAVSRA